MSDVSTWSDLLLTSEGVLKMTVFGLILFLIFVLFGPAPVDEKKLEMDRAWNKHKKRGTAFHQHAS